jgi:protein-L-isoaspartate(D-aspartate) O-methyltransferase
MKTKSPQLELFVKAVLDSYPRVTDERIIAALGSIERDPFFPESHKQSAYIASNISLDGYSTSDPGLVALMVQLLEVQATDTVLDIGAGSGYHAAILSKMASQVYGVEYLPYAVERAKEAIAAVDINNIELKQGDGWNGWLEKAPFDVINIACGLDRIPYNLVDQLKVGGRMILPLAPEGISPYKAYQNLVLIEKLSEREVREGIDVYPRIRITDLFPVRFMTMTKVTEPPAN